MTIFHFLMTVVWFLLIIPTLIWWRNSIPWLAFMSVYANFVGHFGAWDAAKAALAVGKKSE